MGEDGYRADQTRYVCGNPADGPVLDIRGVADILMPQAKSTLMLYRTVPYNAFSCFPVALTHKSVDLQRLTQNTCL